MQLYNNNAKKEITRSEISMRFIELDKKGILFKGIMFSIFNLQTGEKEEEFNDDACVYVFNRKEKTWKFLRTGNYSHKIEIKDVEIRGSLLGIFKPVIVNEDEMLKAIKNEEDNYKE